MLRLDKATYLSLLFRFILSEKISNSLWRSDVLLFPEYININEWKVLKYGVSSFFHAVYSIHSTL